MKVIDGGWCEDTEADAWDRFHEAVNAILDQATPDTDMHIVAKLATQHADFPRKAQP